MPPTAPHIHGPPPTRPPSLPTHAADNVPAANKAYHLSNVALVGLTPVALALHPSAVSPLVDVALAVVLPVHAHVGMNYIVRAACPPVVCAFSAFVSCLCSHALRRDLILLFSFVSTSLLLSPFQPVARAPRCSPSPAPPLLSQISDYVPRGIAPAVRGLMIGVTGATAAGLLYLTATGDGVVGTVKQLWRGGKPATGSEAAAEEE